MLDMDGLHGLLDAFARAVESGAPPETSAADNINSLGIVFAAVESVETGAFGGVGLTATRRGMTNEAGGHREDTQVLPYERRNNTNHCVRGSGAL